MAWRSTVWTAVRVLHIAPDLRDSRRPAGERRVPGDARGPAWWLALLVCKPLLLLGRRADWRRTERLPGSGGAVLAANHVSQADPLFLGEMILAQGRTPRFMAKASLFHRRAVGWWFRSAGHVEVDRSDGRSGIRAAVKAVERGALVVVYPEGSITKRPDGRLMSLRSGAVRIALETSAPLIPVAQWGVQAIVPAYEGRVVLGRRRRRRVTLLVGDPVPLEDLRNFPRATAVTVGVQRLQDTLAAMVDQLADEHAR
ncbi:MULTISPECIES: lysophospholipid acyltransferase family protein [Nocardioides]|uniref:Lysophospholipid acyltransferase family protein n=1 Tax=Nocardioides abyssi TaxID=3058370 RepID=A0ABT8ESS5_9ACTN|nr:MULTISPECIES: lysophospholipid acyltransferase family protein [Nocardioides]MDN4161218.1 lysophospholipid acyltransferase family protein [Nocardioides abyssi]